MNEQRYLLKVLGLSAIPRIVTFLLTLVSFSLMVRAVGAPEYGVFVFLGAIIGIFESFADFGVSAAVGKAVAEARVHRREQLRTEVLRWGRMQMLVAAVGLVPFVGLTYIVVRRSDTFSVDALLFAVVALTSWIAIAANFLRSCLRSTLSFRSLAVIDTAESVLRSAGLLVVAWFVPTVLGLAVATLLSVLLAVAVAALLLRRVLQLEYPAVAPDGPGLSFHSMLRESFGFLGLRLATRLFQALPIVVIGRLMGANIVGIVAAFARIAELIIFPFSVIGNALAVRAAEVKEKGYTSVVPLWDAAFRFILLSLGLAAGALLAADLLADMLVPDAPAAASIFAILSVTVLTSATSAIITPMSDYVGALRQRIVLIGVCALTQLPLISIGTRAFGVLGGIAAFAAAPLLMNIGYLHIAKGAFFGAQRYAPPAEIQVGAALICLSAMLAFPLSRSGVLERVPLALDVESAALRVTMFVLLVGAGLWSLPRLRAAFLNVSLFDVTRGRGS